MLTIILPIWDNATELGATLDNECHWLICFTLKKMGGNSIAKQQKNPLPEKVLPG
jgi:hypothetical protein